MVENRNRFDEVEFTVKCKMKYAQAVAFHSMLSTMESFGRNGQSRVVGFYADGDGAFQPKFESDFEFGESIEPLPHYERGGSYIYDEDSYRDEND